MRALTLCPVFLIVGASWIQAQPTTGPVAGLRSLLGCWTNTITLAPDEPINGTFSVRQKITLCFREDGILETFTTGNEPNTSCPGLGQAPRYRQDVASLELSGVSFTLQPEGCASQKCNITRSVPDRMTLTDCLSPTDEWTFHGDDLKQDEPAADMQP